MRLSLSLALVALACISSASKLRVRNHDTHHYYALHLQPHISPQQVALTLGLDYEGPLGELLDHHTFSSPNARSHDADGILKDVQKRRRKRELKGMGVLEGVVWSQKQRTKPRLQKRALPLPLSQRQVAPPGGSAPIRPGLQVGDAEAIAERTNIEKELSIQDPIFGEQWHLFNAEQLGHDLNVTGVWQQGITGEGATAVMVDDGIDMYSDDLKDNYFAKGSYDFNENTEEPKPRLSDDHHGTRCAGEIAAVKNGVCGVGVAYNAKIGGLRILSKIITDEDEAVAMNYAFQDNQIYSCSWGPPDDGMSMDAPGILIQKAMVNAVQNGRQGKGNIYVFAAGNGNGVGDNCNFDGYTNSIYTITIGGIDRKGLHPYYSERCAAQLAVTYSSGSGDAIHTTDVGTNKCYSNHGGTSAAAPLAAGVFALAFSARPELTWRDLQNVVVETAVQISPEMDWNKTFSGRMFSHTFGYGKLDAYAVVEKAKSIELLKPQAWFKAPWVHVNHTIPNGTVGVLSSFDVTKEMLNKANFERVEHVTVTMNVEHTRRGDLSVELRSPTNMVSHLSVARKLDDQAQGYVDWTFMTVAHWGETGLGGWSVVVKDTVGNEFNGTFIDWRLTLWGECIDPSIQELLPIPTEHDDDDHDVVTDSPTLVDVHHGDSQGSGLPAVPSDHQHRPVNSKPTTAGENAIKPPEPTDSGDEEVSEGDATVAAPATELPETPPQEDQESEHFLPHYFPTFGVSKRTQIWIYGALVIIVMFCVGLGIYFFSQGRKRRRNERDDYEFEVLEEDEGVDGIAGKRTKRRGGELYDAFAGESDEEGLLSEGDEAGEGYRDEEAEEEIARSPSKYENEKI